MPAWVVDIFRANYGAFAANPILFFLALIAGAFLGYALSKLIHKGKIDTVEERVKLETEQIEVKDKNNPVYVLRSRKARASRDTITSRIVSAS
jgi:hypothetical protein